MSGRVGNKKRRTDDGATPATSSAAEPAMAPRRPSRSHAQLVEWFLNLRGKKKSEASSCFCQSLGQACFSREQ